MSVFDAVYEKLIHRYTTGDYTVEVADAKREFFENAGILNDESSEFELRMSQFLDWYLLTRELSVQHQAPVSSALSDMTDYWKADEKELIESLELVKHGIFEYLKSRGSDIYIKDLFEGKKYVIKESEYILGFDREEVFEARLIPHEDNFVFTKGFCFHPAETRRFILKEVKKVKKLSRVDREALMFRLLKMRYKYEQYGHIRLDYIYTNDTKLKF